jgi:pimeloyl-ACP methyl ester carboxylesterase
MNFYHQYTIIRNWLFMTPSLSVCFKEAVMENKKAGIKNVVLVHGGFVDGSGWQGVHAELRKRGFSVTVVQNPTTSLADDVAATRRALATLDGPAVHAVYVSQPVAIASAIEQAAQAAQR